MRLPILDPVYSRVFTFVGSLQTLPACTGAVAGGSATTRGFFPKSHAAANRFTYTTLNSTARGSCGSKQGASNSANVNGP